MLQLVEKYQKSWPGKFSPGYIQYYTSKPLSVVLFTEKVLRFLIKVKNPSLYLDATGSVIADPPGSGGPYYLYSLVLAGDEKYGALPIAEFISNQHTVPRIRNFLNMVNYLMKQIIRDFTIPKIETDFSIALMQSASLSFNGMSISYYLKLTNGLVEKKKY